MNSAKIVAKVISFPKNFQTTLDLRYFSEFELIQIKKKQEKKQENSNNCQVILG